MQSVLNDQARFSVVHSRNEHRWYVASTQPSREHIAKLHLERQGFTNFLPLVERSRRHARRLETLTAPLFPGYIFVRLCLDHSGWRSVNGTVGVASLIGNKGGQSTPMPNLAMDALLESCANGLFSQSNPDLKIGDQLVIKGGPFAEFSAKVASRDTNGRVRLLLCVLGGGVFQCGTNMVERV